MHPLQLSVSTFDRDSVCVLNSKVPLSYLRGHLQHVVEPQASRTRHSRRKQEDLPLSVSHNLQHSNAPPPEVPHIRI